MIVIAPTVLQLGNRLNLYSHCIAFAKEYGHTVVYPELAEFRKYFAGMSADMWCRFPPRKPATPLGRSAKAIVWASRASRFARMFTDRGIRAPFTQEYSWNDENHRFLLDAPENISLRSGHQVIFLSGYEFRAFECRKKHGSLLRQHFALNDPWNSKVADFVSHQRNMADVLVGVHIRRGDYRTFKGGKFYYDNSVYRSAMLAIQEQLNGKKVHFVIFSNEAVSVEEFKPLSVSSGPGSQLEDLYALSHCDYLIGPPSSFSAWAAFMGETRIHWLEDPQRLPQLSSFQCGSSLIY